MFLKKKGLPVSGSSLHAFGQTVRTSWQAARRVSVRRYGVIAFTPSTPAMAVATVTITFKMVFRVSLLIFMMFVFLVLSVRSRPCSRGAGLPELQFRTCALSGRLAGRLLRPGRGTERWLIKKYVCVLCLCVPPAYNSRAT